MFMNIFLRNKNILSKSISDLLCTITFSSLVNFRIILENQDFTKSESKDLGPGMCVMCDV